MLHAVFKESKLVEYEYPAKTADIRGVEFWDWCAICPLHGVTRFASRPRSNLFFVPRSFFTLTSEQELYY